MKVLRCIALSGFVGLALLVLGVVPVAAEPDQPAPPDQGVSNDTCLACHATPGQTIEFPSGEPLYISIDPETF